MIFNRFSIFKEIDAESGITMLYNIIMLFLCIGVVILGTLLESDYYNKEYCFYCDILEILEKINRNGEEECFIPKQAMKMP